jgi:hypothetical protein
MHPKEHVGTMSVLFIFCAGGNRTDRQMVGSARMNDDLGSRPARVEVVPKDLEPSRPGFLSAFILEPSRQWSEETDQKHAQNQKSIIKKRKTDAEYTLCTP